jgi:hypothetical protein
MRLTCIMSKGDSSQSLHRRVSLMPNVTATILLNKLREIHEAVKSGEPKAIPPMLLEAEDCVLQMERELMEELRENERLRRAA